MSSDPVYLAQHVAFVIAFFACCWVWVRVDRLVLGWGAILLFCMGEYGWALLAAWLWSSAEQAHRRFIAEERAAEFYNGPWID